jgi:hypothetical protein
VEARCALSKSSNRPTTVLFAVIVFVIAVYLLSC